MPTEDGHFRKLRLEPIDRLVEGDVLVERVIPGLQASIARVVAYAGAGVVSTAGSPLLSAHPFTSNAISLLHMLSGVILFPEKHNVTGG